VIQKRVSAAKVPLDARAPGVTITVTINMAKGSSSGVIITEGNSAACPIRNSMLA
jgi:hypothetical protein